MTWQHVPPVSTADRIPYRFHFRLAGFIRDLREKVKTSAGPTGNEVRAEVTQLVPTLAAHEEREHEMVRGGVARGGLIHTGVGAPEERVR